ncbi:MAG: chemotaxis protein CheA [Terriglobales bacterium]|jgi:two-component system chemotaxis sensor kinase CheA|nr:chemotaxis protein CheA [Terriglobales bacterium]
MTKFSDGPGDELRELFFETAQELLQALNDEALKLEKQPGDIDAMRSMRRTVHTLKGDAAACGFRELSELAHELEDALAADSVPTHVSLAEIAFCAADTFEAMLAAYQRGKKLPSVTAVKEIIRELTGAKISKKSRRTKAPTAPAVTWTEYEKVRIHEATGRGRRIYQIAAQIDPLCAMPMAARQLVMMELSKVGDVLGTRPEAGAEGSSKDLTLVLASDQSKEVIASRCRIPTIISEVKVQALEAGTSPAQLPAVLKSATINPAGVELPLDDSFVSGDQMSASSSSELEGPANPLPIQSAENTLRVDSGRIDTVLNLVGELIIGKSMLQQALNELAKLHPREAIRGKFADAMAFQSRVLGDLQRSVMKVRMVPVEQLFRRFPRMVRDVAKRCGRDVELAIKGQDTDLDKSLLDAIAEPLTHIVRNAVSHGIEATGERRKHGKPEKGTVRLDAYHHASHVIISISDDGAGIDPQKVKAKALKQGVITPGEASRLTDSEAIDLVFRPGFSTADEITEISGRGVGLDVVRSVLQRLKGTVEIETRIGQGTTFRLKLPLTLAIIKALLFRVEQRLYAIPLNAVAEITRAFESDLHQVESYEVLQLRNQVLPVLRMGRLSSGRSKDSSKIFVLVIAFGERKLGLIVDSLEGEEELVIKALDDQTVTTDLVSGASILGDGRVVLIMNLAGIVERFSKSRSEQISGIASELLLSTAERAQFAAAAAGAGQ